MAQQPPAEREGSSHTSQPAELVGLPAVNSYGNILDAAFFQLVDEFNPSREKFQNVRLLIGQLQRALEPLVIYDPLAEVSELEVSDAAEHLLQLLRGARKELNSYQQKLSKHEQIQPDASKRYDASLDRLEQQREKCYVALEDFRHAMHAIRRYVR